MRTLIILILSMLAQVACAQMITGVVADEENGDIIPHPALQYENNGKAMAGDASGRFSIPRHNDEYLTISAVGYKTLRLLIGRNTPDEMQITLKPETKHLKGVTVNAKRGKYSRKNNPAVELMKRVIAAKKRTDLDNHEFSFYHPITILSLTHKFHNL